MKELGIVICNYNKEDYIVNCIKSVLASSFDSYDVYVVDNASTDGSVDRIREEFGDRVTLLVNQENKGGSGGFNTGLRKALESDYKYIMLLDNDIVMDKEAVKELYQFLEGHAEVGMVGSKVYFMDYPDRIWGYGSMINFDKYVQEDNYKNYTDSSDIPETLCCDYVAACSLMVRTDAVRKVGIMPEKNFIYWDDMEWGYRFNQAGYKVAVWGRSKIWHKAGGRNAGNTFINYYMWRNRIRFFIKFLPLEKAEHFAEYILSDMYRLIYSCNLKNETNIIKSVMYAFDDAIHDVAGKAADYKILKRSETADRMITAVGASKSVVIQFNGNYEGLGNIIRKLKGMPGITDIAVCVDREDINPEEVSTQFPGCNVIKEYKKELYDFHMTMCDHIFQVDIEQGMDIYVDPWCNIIYSEQDFHYCVSFKQSLEIFIECFKTMIVKKMEEYRRIEGDDSAR